MLLVLLSTCVLAALGNLRDADRSCEAADCQNVNFLQTKYVADSMPAHFEDEDVHPFSQRARDYTSSSFTPYSVDTDLSASPSWVWPNPLKEQVRHSPLIDSHYNIYVTTVARIRKFNSSGAVVWTWEGPTDEGKIDASPALHKQSLLFYASTGPTGRNLTLYSLDLQSGAVNWRRFLPETFSCHCDSPSVLAFNDMMILPLASADPSFNGKANTLYAVSSHDGAPLWKYAADELMWNFAGSALEDGSILFGSNCGRAYRITSGGQLVWKSGPTPSTHGAQCSTGGGALGPNGVFYVNSNHFADPEGKGGRTDAYRVTDGMLLWSKKFDSRHGGWQYPAVGKLGPGGPLAVIVPVGGITILGPPLRLQEDQSALNAVVALDAITGEELWRVNEAPWPYVNAAGDEMGNVVDRLTNRLMGKTDPRSEDFCLPDIQGIPLIAGDGTVYASSSHNGDLRAIKDANGNGKIEPEEVTIFSTKQCFLNSPSLAQGMLVVAPCWGSMYVFRD